MALATPSAATDGTWVKKRNRVATAFQRSPASAAVSSQQGPQLVSGVGGQPSQRFKVAWASGQNTGAPLEKVVRTNAQVPLASRRQEMRAKPQKAVRVGRGQRARAAAREAGVTSRARSVSSSAAGVSDAVRDGAPCDSFAHDVFELLDTLTASKEIAQ